MGIYTGMVESFSPAYATDYRDYEPYHGENINFQALGIQAATECAMNHNEFMKSIALEELACFEQTGSTDALYEAVNIKGIFEKIKMIFKKIIDKIQKIFHTFIAKMSAWFGDSKKFAKKYRKELTQNWGSVSNDWEFKGYEFTNVPMAKGSELKITKENWKSEIPVGLSGKHIVNIKKFLEEDTTSDAKFHDLLAASGSTDKSSDYNTVRSSDSLIDNQNRKDELKNAISEFKKAITSEDGKEKIRAASLKFFGDGDKSFTSLDAKEYTEEVYKFFRNDEEDKDNLNKSKIDSLYGGMSGLCTLLEDYDSIRKALESNIKSFTKSIDELIKAVNKMGDEYYKNNDNKENGKTSVKQECAVQLASLYETYWTFNKELGVEFLSAQLQATKDNVSQAKQIAVKVIGNKKSMREESYDYSGSGYTGSSLIDSVKFV